VIGSDFIWPYVGKKSIIFCMYSPHDAVDRSESRAWSEGDNTTITNFINYFTKGAASGSDYRTMSGKMNTRIYIIALTTP
jgi:hypothetical protein